MNDLNPVLISLYVDGEASPEQVLQVEAAVAKDPQAAALLEDLRNLGEIFGLAGPQTEAEAAAEVSGEFSERLHALDRTESLEGFRAVKLERGGGVAWGRIGMAAAALVLAAIGLTQLLYRPEVVVSDLTRQVVDLRGNVLKTERLERVTMRAGDVLRAGKGERISFRLHGALVVLLPRGELKLGDPRDREIFSLEEGMALCTVAEKTDPRTVHAAGCEITVDRAHFGVRVTSPGARPAGPALAASDDADVAVAVSSGSLQVRRDGAKETVRAGSRVVLRKGAPAKQSQVWQDPLYAHLMRLKPIGHEILPGFFSSEAGVVAVPKHNWGREADGTRILVLTGSREASAAHYLVLYLRATQPTALAVTRVMPYSDAPGLAEAVTVETAAIGTEWTVIAIARKAFDAPGRKAKDRKIPAGRSRLVRLELRPAFAEAEFELKASLWASRPPASAGPQIER